MQSWYLGANARLSIPGQGQVNAELWQRFVAGADAHHRATGQRTQVNSVLRSTADQRRFWDAYVRYLQGGPWAPLAARPGSSNHERGTAIDAQPAGGLATTGSSWQRAMTAVGLHFPVNGEPWHVELAPGRRPLPAAPVAPTTPAPVAPPSEEDDMPTPFRLADQPTAWWYIDAGKAHRIPSPSVLTVLYSIGVIRPHPMAPKEDSGIATIGDAAQIRDMRATYGLR